MSMLRFGALLLLVLKPMFCSSVLVMCSCFFFICPDLTVGRQTLVFVAALTRAIYITYSMFAKCSVLINTLKLQVVVELFGPTSKAL